MDLHRQAREDVRRILSAHDAWLSAYRGFLDLGVQDAGGYWEVPNVDFVSIDPCVRSGHVRQFAAGLVGKLADCESPLRVRMRAFAGVHLYTPGGDRIRTRSWPRSRKTGLLMQASTYEQPPLLEDDPSFEDGLFGRPPYEVSVLMDIDLGTKTLRKASVAAIDWGEDDKGQEIYYEEEIPAPPMEAVDDSGLGGPIPRPYSGGPLVDDFSDLLDEEGVNTGTDPA